jgi:hypothetical protein
VPIFGVRKRWLRILVIVLVIAAIVALAFSSHPREPRLSVSILSSTNIAANPPYQVARFRVTNTGDATAVYYPHGDIELGDTGQKKSLATRCNVDRLAPGEQCVVEIHLYDSVPGRWRFTCLFAHAGFRTSLNRRIPSRFVPQRLKGVPLNVKATSDWIEN